jgi:integrase
LTGPGGAKLFKERPRRRRLDGDEEARLLDACGRGDETKGGTDLRALVECALDTCCRKGELLSLQWSQVDFDRNEIFLPAEKTKSGKLRDDGSGDRWIPMTQRVRSRLDMRPLDAAGKERKPADYVFGNAAGEQIKSIKTAWKLACRRAGIVGLHFHDLRREGASSLLESRMSEHAVKDILGHANIKTTSTYLATTRQRLHEQMKRAEAHRAAAEKDAHEDAHGSKAEPAAKANAQIS